MCERCRKHTGQVKRYQDFESVGAPYVYRDDLFRVVKQAGCRKRSGTVLRGIQRDAAKTTREQRGEQHEDHPCAGGTVADEACGTATQQIGQIT